MVPDRQKVRTDDAKTISLRLRRGIKKLPHVSLTEVPEYAEIQYDMMTSL